MALDRTWYNTLVDDDGSGLTGSVWDKADVDALMDAIDTEIARLDQLSGTWTPVFLGGTGVYSLQQGLYRRRGDVVTIQARVVLSSLGSLTGSIQFAGFPYFFPGSYPPPSFTVGHQSGLQGGLIGLSAKGEVDQSHLVFYSTLETGGSMVPIGYANLVPPFDVSLSGSYVTG